MKEDEKDGLYEEQPVQQEEPVDHKPYNKGFRAGYKEARARYFIYKDVIEEISNALNMFTNNVDRWLETGEPATAEESKLIYDTAKSAIEKAELIIKP